MPERHTPESLREQELKAAIASAIAASHRDRLTTTADAADYVYHQMEPYLQAASLPRSLACWVFGHRPRREIFVPYRSAPEGNTWQQYCPRCLMRFSN